MKKKITAFALLFVLLFISINIPTEAATTPSYYYLDGENHFVTKRNVTYEGTSIDLTETPALVIDGYNYVPVEKLISSISSLTGSYTSSSKKITLTYGSKTLVMTVGSTSATLNGSTITLTSSPLALKFSSSGNDVIYVPAKETASRIGLGYEYSNSGKMITFSSESITDDSFKATITLTRPSSVSKGTISCTDDYHNKRLVITMSGNQTTYYTNNAPSLPSGVTFTSSYSSSTGLTSLIFTTTSINGWKVKEDSSKIYIMNGTPTDMFKNVIVLDPGHGGSDPGACYGTTYKESEFNLGIVLAALECFEGNDDFKVYSTRLSNELPSGISKVWDRRTFANNLGADIFVSVHINSYTSSSATGTETLYNSSHNVSNSGGLSCLKLANIVQEYIQAATGFKNRGVKVDSSLSVLNSNNNPAVLTEIGFISNYTEASTMAANLDNYGEALYNAIVTASNQYPTGR